MALDFEFFSLSYVNKLFEYHAWGIYGALLHMIVISGKFPPLPDRYVKYTFTPTPTLY